MNFHFIVPARGGSKGIPNKNLVEVNGKKLINYTLDLVKGTEYERRTVLSSDSDIILKEARSSKIICHKRKPELSTDFASTTSVVDDIIQSYPHIVDDDCIVLLQPTSPLRAKIDIDTTIKLAKNTKSFISLISVYEYNNHTPYYLYRNINGLGVKCIEDEGRSRRQDYPKLYCRNGCIYIVNVKYFKRHKTLLAQKPLLYVMPECRSLNVDSPKDILRMKKLLKNLND